MLRLSACSRAAAALFAAALVLLAASCGGGDKEPSPTPTSTQEQTSPPESIGPVSGEVIDLAAQTPLFTLQGENDDDFPTGSTSVALGDFNGDDEPDLLVGAPQADGPNEERAEGGEAYVIFGPLKGELDLANGGADITIYGALPGDSLGYSVLAGDLNNDAIDDILLSAPGVTAGFDPRTDQGRIYVFYGGDDLKNLYDLSEDVFDFTVTGAEGFSRLGHAMDIGDVNGDGAPDLVAGAPFAGREPGSPPGSERTGLGEVYIIFGSGELSGERNIASLEQDVVLSGKQGPPNFGEFGASLAVADFDGDGTDDIAVGAHRTDAAADRAGSGAVYVFSGRDDWPERLTTQKDEQDVTILGPSASAGFGFPVTSGDYNGDGTSDLAAGSQTEASEGGPSAGAVRILLGPDLDTTIDLASRNADVTLPGTHPGNLLPAALAAGDIDGDGDDELLAGAPFSGNEEGRRSAGLVYILSGGAEVLQTTGFSGSGQTKPLIGPGVDDRLGLAIAVGRVAKEQNGVAVIAPGAAAGEGRENGGAVYVVLVRL